MSNWLREGSAATVKLGPFLDAESFEPLDDLTIQKLHVRISKDGGAYAAASADQGASDAGAPHDEGGEYDISLDADDTDTPGRIRIMVQMTGALPVFREYDVRPQSVYDAFVLGGSDLMIDVEEVAEAVALELGDGAGFTALATASALSSVGSAVGGVASAVGGLNDLSAAQVRTQADAALAAVGLDDFGELVEEDGDAIRFTADALAEAPTGGGEGGGLDAAGVRAAIGLSAANLDTQLTPLAGLSTMAGDIDGLHTVAGRIEADTQDIQSRIPSALIGGRMASDMGSVAGDALAAGDIMGMLAAILTHTGTTLDGKLNALASAVAGLNNLSAAQARAQIDSALTDMGLGAFVEMIENVGATPRFTAAALSEAGGSGWTAESLRGALGLTDPDLGDQLAAIPSSTAAAVLGAAADNPIPAEVREVNGVVVTGDGTDEDPWRAAGT